MLAKPRHLHVSTPWAYKTYDELGYKFGLSERLHDRGIADDATKHVADNLKDSCNYAEAYKAFGNDFEQALFPHYKELKELKTKFMELGALACHMTGSGPTIYAVCDSAESAETLKQDYKEMVLKERDMVCATKFDPVDLFVVHSITHELNRSAKKAGSPAVKTKTKAKVSKPVRSKLPTKAGASKPVKTSTKAKVIANKPAGKKQHGVGVLVKPAVAKVLDALCATYPDADCELTYDSPFQLLIAVILSAQCTDVTINKVTKALFKHYPDARSLAEADIEHVKELIKPSGFFNAKAKNIQACAQELVVRFNGIPPRQR